MFKKGNRTSKFLDFPAQGPAQDARHGVVGSCWTGLPHSAGCQEAGAPITGMVGLGNGNNQKKGAAGFHQSEKSYRSMVLIK